MAKISFDIKYRQQIESGEYKVFAFEHEEQEARIVCWDNKGEYPIVALVDNEPEKFDKYGRVPGGNRGGEFSLFLVTPEPELSEWQRFISACLQKYGLLDCGAADRIAKESAAELIAIARKQLQPEIDAEIEKAYKTADEVQYRKGREEALKDLPRWRKIGENGLLFSSTQFVINGRYLEMNDTLNDVYEIALSDLAKLPKEDSHE